jgi:hypothetical protein
MDKEADRISELELKVAILENNLTKISSSSKFTISHIGMIITVLIGLGGAFAGYLSTVVNPIEKSQSMAIQDKKDVEMTINSIDERLNEIGIQVHAQKASYDSKLIEIETQFSASDQVRNLQHSTAMRNIALLWEKVYGSRFPSEVQYYPTISQHER